MRFSYVAYSRKGKRISGDLDAVSLDVAEDMLWARDLVVVNVRKNGTRLFLRKQLPSLFGVSRTDLVAFTQQFAILLRSGVALYQAINILAEQQSSNVFRSVLREVLASLQQGLSLSQSLEEHEDIFPEVYRRLVRVGESAGRLPEVLERLAHHMLKEEATSSKVRGAMIYPTMILCLAIGAVFILMTVTLPAITTMLREFKSELPASTRLLMDASFWMAANQQMILLVATTGGVALKAMSELDEGRRKMHLLLLRLPLIGSLNQKAAIARMATTTATLLQAGLPLTEIMQLIEETSDNVVLKKSLSEVRDAIVQGASFSEAMSRSWVFPSMVIQMVRVGEESGKLEGSLETISEFYERETDRQIETITGLIGPFLVVAVGGFVGFVFASVISAMYSVYGAIQ